MTGAEDRFKRGDQAARKGNYEYAVELYLQGLTINPKAAEERGRLHEYEARSIESMGGNPQGSMATKIKSMGMQAKLKKLTMQKKWDEALIEIEKVLRFQPRNSSLLLQLAAILEHMEYFDSAKVTLEEVNAHDGRNMEALRRLGRLWADDDPEKAVGYWEKLRMIKPDDKEASKSIRDLSAATMVKRTEERKSESGDESFQALLKDEDQSAELEQKGKVLRTSEDRKAAIRFKLDEIKNEPTNSRLWRELGTLYQEQKEWKHALAAFKKALEVNPHDLFAYDKIGALKEQQADERLEEARKKVESAEKDGGAPENLVEELKKLEEQVLEFKIKEYDRRVRAHPTDYELKLRYGRLLLEGERFDPAIQQFQKAVKDPKFKVASLNCMGICFQRKGVHGIAIQQFEEALKGIADRDSEIGKEIRYNLAVACQEMGDREKALKCFQEIMAADIGYRDISQRVEAMMK
ncbi:MAG: tetratricopeptide repeat protein [Planctomycetes bacterium]|nr:tetratricopeptide repeat protein [Planctomycetota bacterium]